jgi:hypothetical protein
MPTYKQDTKATSGNAPIKYNGMLSEGQVQDDRLQQVPTTINPLTGQPEVIQQATGQATYATPTPSNEMGNARPLFNQPVTSAGNQMFGDVEQRQRSLQNQSGIVQAPLYFKDQTGDGKVTQADVIKARTEGYKE